ncbi:helix-loop-helix DNA-binding domain-containing protein [Powellomyces hirtus]|nr:helix-loop-helix DNA-binding domain-containing protein [Powellomyces hirtus]
MQMPAHGFYSVSMPVHATNGFGVMDQSKMMGSQPSSYSAYGGPGGPGGAGSGGDLDDPNLKPMDVITEKRRRRRESHNAVERRRRDNINEKIQELATLLPDFLPTDDPAASTTNSTTGGPSTTPTAGTTPTSSSQAAPSSSASLLANRPNKGVILRRSVDYIRQIQHFAMLLVDRHHELDTALRAVLDRTGIPEQELGLSQPLGTSVEMPNLAQVQQMQLQMQQMQLQQQHPGQQMGQHGQGHGHGQSQGQQQQQQQGQPTQQHFDLADLGLADHPLDEYENDM